MYSAQDALLLILLSQNSLRPKTAISGKSYPQYLGNSWQFLVGLASHAAEGWGA